jgi:hypothetical protein
VRLGAVQRLSWGDHPFVVVRCVWITESTESIATKLADKDRSRAAHFEVVVETGGSDDRTIATEKIPRFRAG